MKKQTKKKKELSPAKKVEVFLAAPATTQGRKEARQLKKAIEGIKRKGPKKEKVQISVRLSKDFMEMAYAHIEQTNTRITDLLERGLVLAMNEERKMPELTRHVRFLVANTTTEQQRMVRATLLWLAIPDYLEYRYRLDPAWELARTSHLQSGELVLTLPEQEQTKILGLYSRYGRPVEAPGPAQLPSGQ